MSDEAHNEKTYQMMLGRVCATPDSRRRALDMIGRGLRDQARRNARGKGGRSFWSKIASSVSYKVGTDSVTVGASHHAAGHKERGGVISAPGKGPGSFGARALAIPSKKCPRGKRSPRDWTPGELFYLKGKSGKGGMLAREKGKGRNERIEVMFFLRKRVRQRPDPWWPTTDQINDATRQGVLRLAKFMEAK